MTRDRDITDALPKEKGVYILLLTLRENLDITVGKLGSIHFKRGFYVYVGSAMGGINKRIKAHLKKNRKAHWHIDYLLRYADLTRICYIKTQKQEEDRIACFFDKHFEAVENFGASDSVLCKSHLFYSKTLSAITKQAFNYRLYIVPTD